MKKLRTTFAIIGEGDTERIYFNELAKKLNLPITIKAQLSNIKKI
jgi:uncharacterized membrane protein YebE (DUF533 family)